MLAAVRDLAAGAAVLPEYGGGQPRIIEAGEQIQTITGTRVEVVTETEAVSTTEIQSVTETVAEEQETWSVSATITLDQDLDETYNETAVRLELAALYSVPLSWIQLDATAGSLLIAVPE